MNLEKLVSDLQDFATKSLVNIGIALLLLVFGLILISWIIRIIKRLLMPTKLDKTLKPFIVSLTNISLKIILVISVIQVAGVQVTSLIAVLGAASLAIGLAFQGALSNFAGGILILSLRPFHVGDYIEVDSYKGTVEAIHVFNSVLVTFDNKVITIPNGHLAGSTIVNHSAKSERRVDLSFSVGYESDLKKVKKLLEEIASKHPLVLKDKEIFVRLVEHADSALIFTVRVWIKSESNNYWTVHFDLTEQVKLAFDVHNISIPFPQMDVHLDK